MTIFDFLIQGFLAWPWWAIVLFLLGTTHVTIVGVTIYLHRSQSHGAVNLHQIPEHFLRFWLWIGTGQVTREWVAVHRKHHAKCEKIGDPHSPHVYDIKTVLWKGAELYRLEVKKSETIKKYGRGPDDWIERNLYSRHVKLGVSLMLIIDVLLFGVIGVSVWAIQMAWIPVLAAGVVNGRGHYSGYRNFSSPDKSRNIFPWGILIGGEELHNNHHTYPTSAKLSVRWYEFDIGWMYIRLLEFFGLATVNRDHLAPRAALVKEANPVEETAKVVVALRYEILRQFDAQTSDYSYGSSGLVLELRRSLIDLWEDKTLTPDSLAEKFALWCANVRKSGGLWLAGWITNLSHLRVVRK